jgi:hypothetical protein
MKCLCHSTDYTTFTWEVKITGYKRKPRQVHFEINTRSLVKETSLRFDCPHTTDVGSYGELRQVTYRAGLYAYMYKHTRRSED